MISPAQHQIHHSTNPVHFDKNYGVVLSVWDRINGTLVESERNQDLQFGLSKQIEIGEQKLLNLYLQPFLEFQEVLLSRITKSVKALTNR